MKTKTVDEKLNEAERNAATKKVAEERKQQPQEKWIEDERCWCFAWFRASWYVYLEDIDYYIFRDRCLYLVLISRLLN